MLMTADQKISEGLKALSPEYTELYGSLIEGSGRYFAEMQARALPAQDVADVVEHALEATNPKTRYLVTTDAKMGSFMKWLLSDRAFDWVRTKMAG